MKRLLLCLFLFIQFSLPASAAGLSAADAAALRATIDKMNAAFTATNAAAIADVMSERVIQLTGGRAKFIETTQAGLDSMRAQKVALVSYKSEPAEGPLKAGKVELYVVREKMVMEIQGRRFLNTGFTVALRPIGGGAWQLIGGKGLSQHADLIYLLYPEFPRNYHFPEYSNRELPQ